MKIVANLLALIIVGLLWLAIIRAIAGPFPRRRHRSAWLHKRTK